jgi:geranylgeranyl pyrophosphate synthase
MIHAYSLIHDDLPAMDDDALRRGRPTCHIVFGEAVALLAGDARLSHAFETMLACAEGADGDKGPYLRAMRYIAQCAGACGMVAGQTADMNHEGLGEEGLAYIHLNKTARNAHGLPRFGRYARRCARKDDRDFESYALTWGWPSRSRTIFWTWSGTRTSWESPSARTGRNEKLTAVSLWGVEGARQRAAEHLCAGKNAVAGYFGTGS